MGLSIFQLMLAKKQTTPWTDYQSDKYKETHFLSLLWPIQIQQSTYCALFSRAKSWFHNVTCHVNLQYLYKYANIQEKKGKKIFPLVISEEGKCGFSVESALASLSFHLTSQAIIFSFCYTILYESEVLSKLNKFTSNLGLFTLFSKRSTKSNFKPWSKCHI